MKRAKPNTKRLSNPRQRILDYIIAHPGCLSLDVLFDAMPGYNSSTLINNLRDMTKMGEVSRAKDHKIVGTPFRYTALVKLASPPSKQKSRELPDDVDRVPPPIKSTRPGHYINVCGQHDYKGQGGQGGIRERIGVCASWGMV